MEALTANAPTQEGHHVDELQIKRIVVPDNSEGDGEKPAGKVEPRTGNGEVYPSGWKLTIIVVSLCFGTLLIAIDNTIIAVAIPEITTVFKALDDVGWYGSAYLLTVTALQPAFGNVYKYFNVKATYLSSIAIFEVGSILCAAAPSSPIFILGRAIAGLGSAGLFQGALNIVRFIVPLEKRPMYLAIVVSVFGFATCSSPILGGAFTSNVSWRWCFWINLPIGGVVFFSILAFLSLKDANSTERRASLKVKLAKMDFLGTTTLIASVCCLLLALQWGGATLPWKSSKVIGLFVGSALLLVLFSLIQWRLGENATIPPRILGQRSVLMGCSYEWFANVSLYTGAYYIPFYFQSAQGVSATKSGIRYIPFALPQTVAIIASGVIATKTGHYVPLMIIGVIVAAIGTGLLTQIGVGTPTVQWAAFLVLAGLGTGAGIQLPYTALQVVLSEDDLPAGNAIMVFFQQLGGAVSIPVGQTIFLNGLLREVPRHTNAVSPQMVINAGATNLRALTQDPGVLHAIQVSYYKAVTNTLYLATAAIALALPFAAGMQWKNVKRVSAQRKEDEEVLNAQKEGE